MNEDQAIAIADALGAEAWQSGGDIWLVILRRQDRPNLGCFIRRSCLRIRKPGGF